jgi:hypothetical protein
MSIVSPGERSHFVASRAVVRFASMTSSPSTDNATAMRWQVGLWIRTEKLVPFEASM